MQTDYQATYYRDDSTLEVDDGHDSVVTTIRCEEWQVPDRMKDEFGHLALYIPVAFENPGSLEPRESEHDFGYYPEN